MKKEEIDELIKEMVNWTVKEPKYGLSTSMAKVLELIVRQNEEIKEQLQEIADDIVFRC